MSPQEFEAFKQGLMAALAMSPAIHAALQANQGNADIVLRIRNFIPLPNCHVELNVDLENKPQPTSAR